MYYLNPMEEEKLGTGFNDLKKSPFNIEYLLFFLLNNDIKIYTEHSHLYDSAYLSYLKNVFNFNHQIEFLKEIKGCKNFWFYNLSHDENKLLNSKLTSYDIAARLNLYDHQHQKVSAAEELCFDIKEKVIVKSAFGFSGRGNKILSKSEFFSEKNRNWIKEIATKDGYVIVEEYLDRLVDFSILVDNRNKIFYKNIVGNFSEYQSTVFDSKLSLSQFFHDHKIEQHKVIKFQNKIEKIVSSFSELRAHMPYVIDCFIYKKRDHTFDIHPMCEISYRWTMGMVTYHLWKKYFSKCRSVQLSIVKNRNFRINSDSYLLGPQSLPINLLIKTIK